MIDIRDLTALQLGEKINSGQISAVELTRQTLQTLKKENDRLNGIITFAENEALAQAAEIDQLIRQGKSPSLLAGVPIVIKDNISTKGIRTTAGSRMLENYIPPYDAVVIEKLKAAGMIIIAKSNMDEFGMGSTTESSYYGHCRNPKDDSLIPGGSSGGSAALVASQAVSCSLGSDTGGSIRQPATICGVTGFKPSYGRVSRYGLLAYASSMDQIGPICRNVQDCTQIMGIIADDFELEKALEKQKKEKKIRLAIPRELFDLDLDGKDPVEGISNQIIKNDMEKIISCIEIEDKNIQVERVSMPYIKYAVAAYYIIAMAEASSNLARYDGIRFGSRADDCQSLEDLYKTTRTENFGQEVKKRILLGSFVLSEGYYDQYYKRALRAKEMISKSLSRLFDQGGYDYLLMPVTNGRIPKLGEMTRDSLEMYKSDCFTVLANIACLPALSIPVGNATGLQLLGKKNGDEELLAFGQLLEKLLEKLTKDSLEESLIEEITGGASYE